MVETHQYYTTDKDPSWHYFCKDPVEESVRMTALSSSAQFKADIGEKALDGGKYTSHSTIIYSKDGEIPGISALVQAQYHRSASSATQRW